MKTVSIFGDIHGNLPALNAVLADMDPGEWRSAAVSAILSAMERSRT